MPILELQPLESLKAEGLTPFIGRVPVAGESDLSILPEERAAMDALIRAYRGFCALYTAQQSASEDMRTAFTEALHLAQLAVGTVRFYHTLNGEYRAVLAETTAVSTDGVMTSAERMAELSTWKCDFQTVVAARDYPQTFEAVAACLLDAWEPVLQLTARYPDQHVYDDFQRGIQQCEALLYKLHLASAS